MTAAAGISSGYIGSPGREIKGRFKGIQSRSLSACGIVERTW